MVKAYRNRFVCYLLAALTMLAQATCFAQAAEDRVAVIIGNSVGRFNRFCLLNLVFFVVKISIKEHTQWC